MVEIVNDHLLAGFVEHGAGKRNEPLSFSSAWRRYVRRHVHGVA